MIQITKNSRALATGLAMAALIASPLSTLQSSAAGGQASNKGMAVAYPWVFDHGHDGSKTTALQTGQEIARRAGYASISGDVAKSTWASKRYPTPSYGHLPTATTLKAYGKALNAKRVLYGSVSWHTRSIWVGAGPKTISTAKVDAYVFDVAAGKVVYHRYGVEGRSDEKENGWKVAADVLITPLVTVVSGGPATPQEQRAVQIAMGNAYHDWAIPK